MTQHPHLQLLITIVDRGKGETAASLLAREGVLCHHILLGRGTAHKDILDILGLGVTDKDVLLSVLQVEAMRGARERLSHALQLDLPGRGIAFTLPIGSVGGVRALQYLSGAPVAQPAEQERESAMQQASHSLIITIVNRGFTEPVMDAALPAGARGGTVLHARGAGMQEAEQFFGITIQPEKEIVLILVDEQHRLPVMQAITRGAGLSSEGKGITFCLPVGDVMGVARMMTDRAET